jgi:hypothetical protein
MFAWSCLTVPTAAARDRKRALAFSVPSLLQTVMEARRLREKPSGLEFRPRWRVPVQGRASGSSTVAETKPQRMGPSRFSPFTGDDGLDDLRSEGLIYSNTSHSTVRVTGSRLSTVNKNSALWPFCIATPAKMTVHEPPPHTFTSRMGSSPVYFTTP